MRIVRFARPDESLGWGLQNSYGIQDLTLADPSLPTSTSDLIQKWRSLLPRIQSLAKKLGTSDQVLKVLCPIDRPNKILCIGLNYRDHAIETKAPIPDEPIVFCKMATSMIGPDETIRLPKVSKEVDYEAELVVVIGAKMKNVSEQEASQGIFGYSVGMTYLHAIGKKENLASNGSLGNPLTLLHRSGPRSLQPTKFPTHRIFGFNVESTAKHFRIQRQKSLSFRLCKSLPISHK